MAISTQRRSSSYKPTETSNLALDRYIEDPDTRRDRRVSVSRLTRLAVTRVTHDSRGILSTREKQFCTVFNEQFAAAGQLSNLLPENEFPPL